MGHGNSGYPRGFGRDGGERVLREMAAVALLDRDPVLSALSAYDVSVAGQEAIAGLVDEIVPSQQPGP